MPSHHQYHAVKQYQPVKQWRQGETVAGYCQGEEAEHCRRNLEHPGGKLPGFDSRPDKGQQEDGEPGKAHQGYTVIFTFEAAVLGSDMVDYSHNCMS